MIRILAIDPGKHIGWCVVDVAEHDARWVAAGTIELADGGEIDCAGELAAIGVEHIARAIAIEDFARKYVGPAQAQQMVQSSQSAGIIRGWLSAKCSCEVVPASSYDWRKTITGTPTAKDKQIEHALVEIQHVADMPKRSNPHVRDACGLGIFVGRKLLARKAAS